MKTINTSYILLFLSFGLLCDIAGGNPYPVMSSIMVGFAILILEAAKKPKHFLEQIPLNGQPLTQGDTYPDKIALRNAISDACYQKGLSKYEIVWMERDWMNAFSIQKADGTHLFFFTEGLVERLSMIELRFCAEWLSTNAKANGAMHLYKYLLSRPHFLFRNEIVGNVVGALVFLPAAVFGKLFPNIDRKPLDEIAEISVQKGVGFVTLTKLGIDFTVNIYEDYPFQIEGFSLFSSKDNPKRISDLLPKDDGQVP